MPLTAANAESCRNDRFRPKAGICAPTDLIDFRIRSLSRQAATASSIAAGSVATIVPPPSSRSPS
jgi:hypothetical protein